VAEHHLMAQNLGSKSKTRKGAKDNSLNKFVAIYSKSNSCKPKLNTKDSFKENSEGVKSNQRGSRYK